MRGGINQEVIREAHATFNDPKCAADAAEDKRLPQMTTVPAGTNHLHLHQWSSPLPLAASAAVNKPDCTSEGDGFYQVQPRG
jgi:hypothetical protein